MGNRVKWKSVWAVARIEYARWITNPRIIIVGVLLVFMKGLAVDPLIERAGKMGQPLNVFEPFVAVGNSQMLVMLLPCVFMILLGDYPILSDGMLFAVHRAKKANWFLGQVVFLILAIFSFLGVVLGVSMAMSGGRWGSNWSDVVTKYQSIYPNEAGNFASQLLPSNLYNQIPLYRAVIQTFVLLMAYLLLLALILYVCKLLKLGALGMISACAVIGLGVVTCSMKQSAMWIFPMANTMVWLHYDEILREQICSVWFSFAYFFAGILLLLIGNFVVLRNVQFMGMEID